MASRDGRMGVFVTSNIVLIFALITFANSVQRPHVIFIVADDLGWNDLGFRNPNIISPNLDKLAKSGVIFNQSYVQYLCTPSRSTFMTGYYPFRTGLQHSNLQTLIPAGVPTRYRFLPEELRDFGYDTHIVGKWHLGYCNLSYTPTFRGFDTFLGYYTGSETYFSHEDNGHFDFRNNTAVKKDLNGTYSTVPDEYVRKYPNIKDADRRNYSAMVTALDDAVGNIVQTLKSRGLYNNSVIIFTTDNGGQILMGGNNYPLRGDKGTLWEGGTRATAFVHSPLLNKTGYVNNEMMHSVDWYPTIIAMAGGNCTNCADMDGMDQWPMIGQGLPSKRTEFVYNIDNFKDTLNAAIRTGDYKLIVGKPGVPDGWYPPKNLSNYTGKGTSVNGSDCRKPAVLLFNLKSDPTEHVDLATSMPKKVKELWKALRKYVLRAVKPYRPKPDPAGEPKYWGGAYSPGWCKAI